MNIYRLCKDPKRTVTLYFHPILNTDMEFTTSCAKIRHLSGILVPRQDKEELYGELVAGRGETLAPQRFGLRN